MNRLKSIFISGATMAWAYLTYVFVFDLLSNGLTLYGFGLFFIYVLPFLFFMILLFAQPVARTSKSLMVFTVLVGAGFLLVIVEFFRDNVALDLSLMAGGSLVIWLLYIYWYSFLPSSRGTIEVGNLLPELTFIDNNSKTISSTMFNGKKVLYMFYRGNWCPLCMAQIKEISSQYQELEKRGVEVLLISPQRVSKSAALAKKMKVNFHFLTDEKNAMARKLKIDVKYGIPLGFEVLGYDSETVLPTVIIADEEGKIIFIDQTDNYRVRPEPETFLKVLDS